MSPSFWRKEKGEEEEKESEDFHMLNAEEGAKDFDRFDEEDWTHHHQQ